VSPTKRMMTTSVAGRPHTRNLFWTQSQRVLRERP
jgi:hypothetical protein